MDKQEFAKMVQAWADGAEVQYRAYGCDVWIDQPRLLYPAGGEYRIKPKSKIVQWRVALFGGGGYDYVVLIEHRGREQATAEDPMFIRWLTDWQETEV